MQSEALVPLSEAKVRFHALIRALDDRDVLLLRHGRPVATLIAFDRWQQILDHIEDLEDRLSVHEADNEPADTRVPWGKVRIESGLPPVPNG